MEIGLSLGSNLGNRLANLESARDSIADIAGVSLIHTSPVYETEPVDVAAKHRNRKFLNAIIIIETKLHLSDFSIILHSIEDAMGRKRGTDRNAPRTIDIDIIYAGSEACSLPGLVLPHPRWSHRRFVAAPLADVRPDLILPGTSMTVMETLLSLPESPKVIVYRKRW